MRSTRLSDTMERALGQIGLFLMLVVARLANRGYSDHQAVARGLPGLLARRAIDVIAAIGWLADRLLPSPFGAPGAHAGGSGGSAAVVDSGPTTHRLLLR